tara:strand:- start:525 stop:1202 length:678 start_codon:yes stop_codon:yes gene_type:complete
MVRYDKIIRTMNIKGFLEKNMLEGQTGLKKAAYNFASEMLEELSQENIGDERIRDESKVTESLDTFTVNLVGELLSEPPQILIDFIRDYEVKMDYQDMAEVIDLSDEKIPQKIIERLKKINSSCINLTIREIEKKFDWKTGRIVENTIEKSDFWEHYVGHLILAVGSKLKGEYKEHEDEPEEKDEKWIDYKEDEEFKPDWQDKLSSVNFNENWSISWWNVLKGEE